MLLLTTFSLSKAPHSVSCSDACVFPLLPCWAQGWIGGPICRPCPHLCPPPLYPSLHSSPAPLQLTSGIRHFLRLPFQRQWCIYPCPVKLVNSSSSTSQTQLCGRTRCLLCCSCSVAVLIFFFYFFLLYIHIYGAKAAETWWYSDFHSHLNRRLLMRNA